VVAASGVVLPAGDNTTGALRPEAWNLEVKTQSSLLDGDGSTIDVASSLERRLRSLVSTSGSVGGGLVARS
jgi:hypothetical protein